MGNASDMEDDAPMQDRNQNDNVFSQLPAQFQQLHRHNQLTGEHSQMLNELTQAQTNDAIDPSVDIDDPDYLEAMQYYNDVGFKDENVYTSTKMDLGELAPYMRSK